MSHDTDTRLAHRSHGNENSMLEKSADLLYRGVQVKNQM